MASMVADIQDITKMKVAEIKKELKSRGLSTAGTKTELVERLKAATSETVQDDASVDGNVDTEMLDEDEVLGGDEEEGGDFDDDDLAADAVLADEPKPQTPPAAVAVKRPAPQASESQDQPKKRILVRPISALCEKENENGEKETKMDIGEDKTVGKKVIKLSGVTLKERLELRAQKFGVPLPEAAKKEVRAARFGLSGSAVSNDSSKSATSTKAVSLKPSEEVLKKRAERFGVNVSSLAQKMEETDKKEKRKERFGVSAVSVSSLEEKKKLRAERFKI